MKRIETGIDGLFVVEPEVFGDHRGWFMESWSKRKFEEIGIDCEFVQDNHSFSEKKGTLRGLHFQKGEYVINLKKCILEDSLKIKNFPCDCLNYRREEE